MPSIIAGLLAFALGLWGLSVWWYSVEELLRGIVPLALLLFGMVALMAGVSRVATVADQDKSDEDLMDLADEPTPPKRTEAKKESTGEAVAADHKPSADNKESE